jgi:hypothetical protein
MTPTIVREKGTDACTDTIRRKHKTHYGGSASTTLIFTNQSIKTMAIKIVEEQSPNCSYFKNPILKKEFIISVNDVFMRVNISDFESEAEAEEFCKSIVKRLRY